MLYLCYIYIYIYIYINTSRAISHRGMSAAIRSRQRYLLVLLLLLDVFVSDRFRLEIRQGMTDADRVLLSLIGLGVLDVLMPRHAQQPSPGGGALEAHRRQKKQADQGHPCTYQELIGEGLAPFLCGSKRIVAIRLSLYRNREARE